MQRFSQWIIHSPCPVMSAVLPEIRSMTNDPVFERIVELSSTVGTALILDYPTGIGYTNQVGGTACLQPTSEGVLIPFENDYDTDRTFMSLEIELNEHFQTAWGGSGATSGINADDADAVDGLLRARTLIDWFRVDRDRLRDSCESWIHVTVISDHAFYCHGFGPYPRAGILTWANSD